MRAWATACASAIALFTWQGSTLAEAPQAKPKPIQIAFFQLEAQGVEAKVSSIVTDMLLGEMSKMKDARVIGSKEVDAMLGYEQKKQMAGCTDTSCMVAIGGALGVDKILMGSVGKLGSSYTLNLKLINIKQGNIEELYSKRMKGGTEEEFLDIMPEALATIFPASASTWIKGQKGPTKSQEPIEVVDLQRTPGQMKVPEKKEPSPVVKADPPPPPAVRQDNEKGPTPAVEKKVPPPEEKEGPYSHAGKIYVAGKGLFTVPKLNAAGELGLGYGVGKWVELGAVGIFSSSYGGALRAQSFVYNPDGMVKPFVAVQVPFYRTADGNMIGVSGAPGVQVDILDMLGFTAEVAAEYYFALPKDYKSLLVFALAGAQVRF